MSVFSFISGIDSSVGIFNITSLSLGSLDSHCYSYEPSLLDVFEKLDFGGLSLAPTTTINNGLVADLNATQVEYGRVVHVGNLESFGFFKTLNAASWKATSAWVGEGNLISFGRQTSPAVYGIITDGQVKGLSGTADVYYSPAFDGRGILPLQGNSGIGIGIGIFGSGTLFTIASADDSFLPTWTSRGYLGKITGAARDITLVHETGFGNLFTFSGGQQRATNAFAGSGGFKLVSRKPELPELSDEKHTQRYTNDSIIEFSKADYGYLTICHPSDIEDVSGTLSGTSSGCIVRIGSTASIDPGTTYGASQGANAPSNFIDYGLISEPAAPQVDFGEILTTSNLSPFGLFHIDPNVGAADKFLPTWTSRGYISKLTGQASVPLDVTVFGSGTIRKLGGDSITNFSLLGPGDGLFGFHSESRIGIGVGIFGDGSIPTISGAADSVTVNPKEKDLLFSLTGEAEFAFNPNWIGSGVLFTLQTAVEKTVYDYVGSGGLFGFNNLEEVKVYSYNCSSIVPFTEPDYGFIIDPNAISCDDVDGVISTNTTSATGCTKVLNSLVVDPGVTYTITPQYTVPSSTLDYGFVVENASPLVDHGHILGTPRQGLPACIYGQIDIFGAGDVKFTPNYNGSGYIRLDGIGISPLFAREDGSGEIKLSGNSKTVFSLLQPGDGLFRFRSDTEIGITVGIKGTGTLFGYTGTAESISTVPPTEEPIFTFVGTSGDPGICISTEGDGNLFAIGGGELLRLHSYDGSGRLFGFDSKEEARTYVYDGGICRDIPDYDYGFLQGVCLNIETIQGI